MTNNNDYEKWFMSRLRKYDYEIYAGYVKNEKHDVKIYTGYENTTAKFMSDNCGRDFF